MKNKKLLSITVGIPAFNEELNIALLINDLLEQKNVYIERIIVASDGSTDNTEKIVEKFKNKRILLHRSKKREGLSVKENQIMEIANSDILVLINADVRINDSLFLEKLTLPISDRNSDLTSPNTEEITPESFFEKILFISMKIKKFTYENYNKGNNVYTCHGQARALSKRFYKKLKFKSSIGEDAYSYFFCIKNKFVYKFIKMTNVYYRLPVNFNDHKKQSIRFYQSQRLMEKYFGSSWVKLKYNIPKLLLIKASLIYFINYPIQTSLYFITTFYLKFKSFFEKKISDKWEISDSSKMINHI